MRFGVNLKETLEKSEKKAEKDAKTAQDKIEDLQGQIKYLNESMGNMKVDHDLQLEKLKKEKDQDGSTHNIGKFTTFFFDFEIELLIVVHVVQAVNFV